MSSACVNPVRGYLGWSCSPKLDEPRTAWRREADPAKRQEIIRQIQLVSAEQVPIVLLVRFFSPMACRSNLTNLLNTPLPVLWNVSKS
jgi:peptide/nickel transport system substrate-binding protein